VVSTEDVEGEIEEEDRGTSFSFFLLFFPLILSHISESGENEEAPLFLRLSFQIREVAEAARRQEVDFKIREFVFSHLPPFFFFLFF